MPRILETISRQLRWEWQHTNSGENKNQTAWWGNYEPRWEVMDAKIANLVCELEDDQWEVKSVTPLTSSRYMGVGLDNRGGGTTVWGGGYGYATPVTVGVIVLAQRWVEVSEDELAQRSRERAQRQASQAAAARRAEHDRIMALPIKASGIFSKEWVFNGEKYPSEGAAVVARKTLAEKALG